MTKGWFLRLMTAVAVAFCAPVAQAAMVFISDDPGAAGWNTELGIVAEGRIGDTVSDGGSNRTFEIDTGLNTWQSDTFSSANYSWPNWAPLPFVFTFDGQAALFMASVMPRS